MCEPAGFGPRQGRHVRQQIQQVGFLGGFSLLLSFAAKKKVKKNNSIIQVVVLTIPVSN
jgi:hypothetical protein